MKIFYTQKKPTMHPSNFYSDITARSIKKQATFYSGILKKMLKDKWLRM